MSCFENHCILRICVNLVYVYGYRLMVGVLRTCKLHIKMLLIVTKFCIHVSSHICNTHVCPSEIEIWKETLLKWTIISSTVNWAVVQQSHRELISSGLYMHMYVIWVHVCSKCTHESVEWCIHLTKYFFTHWRLSGLSLVTFL